MSDLILMDMDGTLSNDSHRRDLYVPGGYSDYWKPENMMADIPFTQALSIWHKHEKDGDEVGVLAARLHEYNFDITEKWLKRYALLPKYILLRHDSEKHLRPPEFKLQAMKDALAVKEQNGWDNVVLYDNDPDVVAKITEELGPEYVKHCTWDLEDEKKEDDE